MIVCGTHRHWNILLFYYMSGQNKKNKYFFCPLYHRLPSHRDTEQVFKQTFSCLTTYKSVSICSSPVLQSPLWRCHIQHGMTAIRLSVYLWLSSLCCALLWQHGIQLTLCCCCCCGCTWLSSVRSISEETNTHTKQKNHKVLWPPFKTHLGNESPGEVSWCMKSRRLPAVICCCMWFAPYYLWGSRCGKRPHDGNSQPGGWFTLTRQLHLPTDSAMAV